MRGFGFIDLAFKDQASWKKCIIILIFYILGLSTYNGSLWKGKKFIIEQVKKPCFPNENRTTTQHAPIDDASFKDLNSSSSDNVKKSTLKKNKYVFHSALMDTFPLVTDKNFPNFKV